jgi:hypothetical protein
VATGFLKQDVYAEVEKSIKLLFLHHISLKCGDSKDSVATKVVNVATRTFWLDSTALDLPYSHVLGWSVISLASREGKLNLRENLSRSLAFRYDRVVSCLGLLL